MPDMVCVLGNEVGFQYRTFPMDKNELSMLMLLCNPCCGVGSMLLSKNFLLTKTGKGVTMIPYQQQGHLKPFTSYLLPEGDEMNEAIEIAADLIWR